MRTADIKRDTRETRIQLSLNLDGTGKADIASGVGFLDHMLELFARHGDLDLTLRCQGDTQVDGHHSVEDIGICLGRAFTEALGDKRGITRYGQFLLPMDETLVLVACDLSGRDYLGWSVDLPAQKVGDFDTELAKEFFIAFAREAGITLINALWNNTNEVFSPDVASMGCIQGFDPACVCTTTSLVNGAGIHPLCFPKLPGHMMSKIYAAKEYEKLAVEAAVTGSYHAALEALVANPLVNSYYKAKGALNELLVAEKQWLPNFSEAIEALEKGEEPKN